MDDNVTTGIPRAVHAILRDTAALGFGMASEPRTGALLKALAASKPRGRILELGTGTGVGTAWLLAGMDAESRLDTVDNDPRALAVAKRHLANDPRVTFHDADGAEFLGQLPPRQFDLVYADTWAGKFSHRADALALVGAGGIYLVDDLLPQPNWPDGHAEKVPPVIADLEARAGFTSVRLAWASGLLLLVRTNSLACESG